MKKDQSFKGNAISQKVELFEKNDPLIQLETSKSSIKDLFNDILDKKGFLVSSNTKIWVKKYKPRKEIKFFTVYFNTTTKTVIKYKFDLDKMFQKILYKIDGWINKSSAWIIESIKPHLNL